MAEKKKKSNLSFMGLNILVAAIIVLALVFGVFSFIKDYTHHGEFEVVPELKGLSINEASLILESQGLYPEIIDSVYVGDKKLGSIIEQIPVSGSTVKRSRSIYLIVNSREVRKIPLPDVMETSFRQASATLKSLGFNVSAVHYRPSEYKNLVIDVQYQGETVHGGTKLPENSSVELIVGKGMGDELSHTPMLKGLSLDNARHAAISGNMIIGAVIYDVPPTDDEEEYIIYRQRPAAGDFVSAGTRIDVWMSKDASLMQQEFVDDSMVVDEFF